MMTTIQQAMSDLLSAMKFEQMAKDVLGETEKDRLCRYARVIVKSARPAEKMALASKFRLLNLY